MKIDGNELAILQNDLDREGKKEEALKIKLEFLRQVRESGDHCPCKEACRHHGNCFECVTIHRGHRDHLPMCLWDMVNERLAALSHMTEGTLRAYIAQGEVLPVATGSFGGIGVFAIHEMGRFYRHVLVQKRYPHHGAVAFGHYGKALFEAFKFLGVGDIAYNQPKTERYPQENPFC